MGKWTDHKPTTHIFRPSPRFSRPKPPYQTKLNKTRPHQTKLTKTKPDHPKPAQTGRDHTSNETRLPHATKRDAEGRARQGSIEETQNTRRGALFSCTETVETKRPTNTDGARSSSIGRQPITPRAPLSATLHKKKTAGMPGTGRIRSSNKLLRICYCCTG